MQVLVSEEHLNRVQRNEEPVGHEVEDSAVDLVFWRKKQLDVLGPVLVVSTVDANQAGQYSDVKKKNEGHACLQAEDKAERLAHF